MQKDTFFITTPIYYTNGVPHIGHAYSSIICDIIARYNRINGKRVKFSTGVDENSQKAILKAKEVGMEIMEYLDMMAKKHKSVWDRLGIEYTDFIRTTERRHHSLVREVLQKCFDSGDIYEGEYEGMYCVGCEAFKKDEDLVYFDTATKEVFPCDAKIKVNGNIIKVCPDHLVEPQRVKEKNWFFKLSKYEGFLRDLYENNPDFVIPHSRFNEVKAFVDRGLEDFSISRETNKFGIKLPFDETQVTYVWFDALFNYVTVCKYPDSGGNDEIFWPADLHVVAKDIIRFHAVYWPAMLKSAGYEIPKSILTTGYFTINGQKISKSLGNAIDPVEFSAKYSKDLLTLYMLSSVHIGQDGDFNEKEAIFMYNAKLANNLGNLLNRVVVLSLKLGGELSGKVLDENFGLHKWLDCELSSIFGRVKENGDDEITKLDGSIKSVLEYIKIKKIPELYSNYNLKGVLDLSFKFLDVLNDFITKKEPWKNIEDEEKLEKTREILYTAAEGLRQIGLALYPFFPEKMSQMFARLGLGDHEKRLKNGELQALVREIPVFTIKQKGENLFNRI